MSLTGADGVKGPVGLRGQDGVRTPEHVYRPSMAALARQLDRDERREQQRRADAMWRLALRIIAVIAALAAFGYGCQAVSTQDAGVAVFSTGMAALMAGAALLATVRSLPR